MKTLSRRLLCDQSNRFNPHSFLRNLKFKKHIAIFAVRFGSQKSTLRVASCTTRKNVISSFDWCAVECRVFCLFLVA
jgi:hypothetical protein